MAKLEIFAMKRFRAQCGIICIDRLFNVVRIVCEDMELFVAKVVVANKSRKL